MNILRRIVPALILLTISAASANAQAPQMPVGTVSAGAAASSGDGVRLQSTLGQAAAGRSAGTAHIVSAGFWHQVRADLGVVVVNNPPSGPQITEPADRTEIVVGGGPGESPLDPGTSFTVRWSGAADPDGDPLTYTWQVASDSAFSDMLLQLEIGAEDRLEATFGTIALLLDAADVELGGSITLSHRIVASDGQYSTAGTAAQLTLVRGTLVSTDEDAPDLPTSYGLHQNYPNPFNPTTAISYDLPSDVRVRLAVYDVFGREIATLVDEKQRPGRHEVSFAANDLASGLYLYRIEAGAFQAVRSMLLIK